jgi:hypothetical protein
MSIGVRKLCFGGSALVLWVVLLGVLALPVLADTAPAVTVKAPTGVTATTVVVGGTVDPNGGPSATAWSFEYARDPQGSEEGWTPAGGGEFTGPEAAGKSPVAVPAVTIEGLEPNTVYQVRLVATNEGGEGVSAEPNPTFKTLAIKPSVDSEGAPSVKSSGATLEALVNPNNEKASGYLQYSTSAAVNGSGGLVTATKQPAVELGEGYGDSAIGPETLTGLSAGTTYYYQAVASNTTGASYGAVQSFTTVSTPTTDAPTLITATTATFNGSLTPLNATEATSYSFSYKPATASECVGEGALSTPAASAGPGSGTASVSTPVTGLLPDTEYAVCLIASNAYGTEQATPPQAFKTPQGPPVISEEHTTDVKATSAKLGAEVDPQSSETTYHFEYDTTPYTTNTEHGDKTPATPLLAADNSEHTATAPIQGLTPGTEYHYRLVASNEVAGKQETAYGPDETFTTQGPGGAVALPDHRQYELVSPADKDGAEVFGITGRNGVVIGGSSAVQASPEGNSITYLTNAPTEANPAGNSQASQIISSRATNGEGQEEWSSKDIMPANKKYTALTLESGEPFRLFSTTLSRGVFQENVNVPSQAAIVLRNNEIGGSPVETEVSPSTATEKLPQPVEFEAATPDLNDLILSAGEGGKAEVYEWSHGVATQVNILENEEPAPGAYLGGYKLHIGNHEGPSEFAGRHAVSADGSRVVWGTETELFSRDMLTDETVQLDSGPEGSGGGVFQLASADGTRVFFTDENVLTHEDIFKHAAIANSLYMFNVPSRQLTDLGPVGIGVFSGACKPCFGDQVLGADEAGTAVYVTSETVFTGEANGAGESAVAGGGNVFLFRESPVGSGSWSTSFVTTLSASDEAGYNPDPGVSSPQHLAHLPVRVSGDGEYFAFMSDRSLTGYDNQDVNEQPTQEEEKAGVSAGTRVKRYDEEVYEYHAPKNTAAEPGALVCASCNPTGARPVGELDTGEYPGSPMDPNREWGEPPNHGSHRTQFLAAAIPPWNEAIHQDFGPNGEFELPLYASRVLSDSGRLFFDSVDGLVPQDENGREDVYEYEPPAGGEGPPSNTCAAGSSTYGARSAGCVSLISSGQGAGNSEFVDASTNGDDVFFVTADRLVAADTDSVSDMYDASVCGTGESEIHACLPESAGASPPCDSTDSCQPASLPQPGVFGAPPSATFSGAGNLAPVVTPKAKAKPLTRAQKLAAALKACKKDRAKGKRAKCEKQAHKQYGPVKSKKAGTKRRARS